MVSRLRREPEKITRTVRSDPMMSNAEIKEWLGALPDDANIGVDEGGLTLQVEGSDAYLEVGGMPETEGDSDIV
jgi:hypothetical protein